ncbi:AmmeMemoRadiSam system protein B [Candidatus Uhrbacteria bacterium RIFCSPHIGHO2_02_FULL_47_44]|uniref:AmmeMemoRadiSam system protein B n=1 Tax=Candidatus Uhrbacteria bacterium RIFCSPLOWO2_02_FULL_48_18 TaxID=1802408 RepID=A0A1F7VBR6_9BACT|nr:MAG: AmmeMemoRadiSam system protein B [Candidatus Uhrbacteria bacterium RIFCSPHIGHO2_01_FULL_47_10]OGL70434.1 MAG: AmmeMemoRadiSam system protein B [Candidatus Uhrbacteria bacterium RIFCSPHIGHO2_02_FULL_47_44]OGL76875.1 MAG: AmmeMemoRadiSam system protein B [Candidatus Uhrbacteria bacterium RIFCSPHIGHO2_12_FULL_47_12]OGL82344.1 MAG: AmmeMemoRadiSam system protein B [Candidatus Uhrbacteria bacterium RIFCSPLOWO2_01_FULL_47_17]OGL87990.1 MAG: AmmeMemoRadiSam system protein B [Candidatus Uhrbact
MITFAAFTPHSPLLLESIGKENTKALQATLDAMQRLSEELYASRPDVILTISTHRGAHKDAFSLNMHDEYFIDVSEFGDHGTHDEFLPDIELMTNIQRRMRSETLPFTLDSDASLDYGVGIPLTLLTKALPITHTIVPIAYSFLSSKAHVEFGRILKDICVKSSKRIAIIASGDLSHTLTSNAPAGFHPSGEEVDIAMVKSIENMSLSQLLSMDDDALENSQECAHRPLLILFGMLEKMPVRPEILSYEHPFGVGQLVAQFHLN